MLAQFKTYQMAKRFYLSCKSLKISYFLQDQLLRASSSMVLNIAEGSGKRTPNDQRRFYAIALGSLRECRAILEIEEVINPALYGLADELGAILFVLSRKADERSFRSPTPAMSSTKTATETETGT